ncbi:uncharacterized protein LOC113165383 [Anabas testudineus]|uniref:uncharacterized protein LOC113165383 n=1 Tax=Anabas testudineus TaxID=64144 RepID=UPI000E457A5F|nr:uncharacterized protein LOC113165383 [Anabas testudineus]
MNMASLSNTLSGQSKEQTRGFLSRLKNEFLESPLASNVVLGFILAGFEKLVELDFACPCRPLYNACFAAAYIVLPGVVASVVMLCIQGCRKTSDIKHRVLLGIVPFLMWLILAFFDGQYYACAKTYWSGRFVMVDKSDHQKWCEPDNSTLSQENMSHTQQWYFHSQLIGLVILVISTIAFGVQQLKSKYCKCCEQDSQGQAIGSNNNASDIALTEAPVE